MRTRWFGEPWPARDFRAPICDSDRYEVPVPVGEQCIYCENLIEPDDRGVVMAAYPGMEEAFPLKVLWGEEDSVVVVLSGRNRTAERLLDAEREIIVCAQHLDCFLVSTMGPEILEIVKGQWREKGWADGRT